VVIRKVSKTVETKFYQCSIYIANAVELFPKSIAFPLNLMLTPDEAIAPTLSNHSLLSTYAHINANTKKLTLFVLNDQSLYCSELYHTAKKIFHHWCQNL